MLLHSFTATQSDTETSFRIEQAIQELDCRRSGPISVFLSNLGLGFPEVFSLNITHPTRDECRPANNVALADMVLWAQHGRGELLERVTIPVSPDGQPLTYEIDFRIYVGDQGPIEVLADDHFMVTARNLIPGTTYDFHGPEQQIIGSEANKYIKVEPGIILATDRDRRLQVLGKQGIILPNRPDVIQDLVLTTVSPEGNKADKKLDMFEVNMVQTDANPRVVQLTTNCADASKRETDFLASADADRVLIMFGNNAVQSVLIDNILGTELRYAIFSVEQRA